ncbi:hypothetical protein [Hymenobacter sp. BRD67]|uniref:hypothetical protein n=1 Tax=Hymenobacter sp. BRD67 TaxID=2675877 RepID=UPI0015650246|nr:hypothetical protein [Hymenobacter sp. BRD67]QKG51430.1 hypothetical protein GKZ67_01050 [Hymenobacter sp. BRD67]
MCYAAPLPYCHRLLSAFLALLVLATSVGLTAERHRCRISGRSTVALSLPGQASHEAEALTSKPGRPCQKRRAQGCCDVSHLHHKLSAQSADAGPGKWLPEPPPLLPPAVLPAPVWSARPTPAPLALAVAAGTAANASPPGVPRAGRTLLTLGCKLVV